MITTIHAHTPAESRTVACDRCGVAMDPGAAWVTDAPWDDERAINAALCEGWLVDIYTPGLDRCSDCARAGLVA